MIKYSIFWCIVYFFPCWILASGPTLIGTPEDVTAAIGDTGWGSWVLGLITFEVLLSATRE